MDMNVTTSLSSDGGGELAGLPSSKLEFAVDHDGMPTEEVANAPAVAAAWAAWGAADDETSTLVVEPDSELARAVESLPLPPALVPVA